MSDEKFQKVVNMIAPLFEEHPNLERIMIDDFDNPNYVIVCTEQHFMNMQRQSGIKQDLRPKYPKVNNKNKKVH